MHLVDFGIVRFYQSQCFHLSESPKSETHLERGRVEDIPDYNREIAQELLGAEAMPAEPATTQTAATPATQPLPEVEDRLSTHELTCAVCSGHGSVNPKLVTVQSGIIVNYWVFLGWNVVKCTNARLWLSSC